MHGLINRAVQDFMRDSYGAEAWLCAVRSAGLEAADFEPMLIYDDAVTEQIVAAVAGVLQRRPSDVLEDIGHYLVTHERMAHLRRLLRFGGVDFAEVVQSLDDLPDWARLAVEDLRLPPLEVRESGPGGWLLRLQGAPRGSGYAAVGMLRAMADDYGTLAFVEYQGAMEGAECVEILLLDQDFAQGRAFQLAAGA